MSEILVLWETYDDMNKPDPKSLDRRLTLRLPAKLLKQLKVAAAQADLNLQNYVLNTLTKEVRR